MSAPDQPSPASPAPHSIYLLCPSYPPVLGGTEIEAQRVCAMLREKGHAVTVLCVGGPPMPAGEVWTDNYGTPVRQFGSGVAPRWRHYAYGFGAAWALFRKRRHFSIAYFLMGGFQLATCLPVARLLGKTIVMKFSGSNTISPLTKTPLGRIELRFLRRWAARILVLNPAMFQEAEAAGLSRSQLAWMPNPVDTRRFAPPSIELRRQLRGEWGVDERSLVVLYAGRLAPEKELSSLIRAFALMRNQIPDAQLILVGAGPLQSELSSLAALLGLAASVRFTGAVAPDQVCDWMQTANIFALVSSLEGLPCALIEAMSTGLPAVVSGISANRQLVDDSVHGLIAPCGDTDAIAGALVRLALDPDLRARCGGAARARIVESYSNERVVARYESLFEQVTSAKDGAAE